MTRQDDDPVFNKLVKEWGNILRKHEPVEPKTFDMIIHKAQLSNLAEYCMPIINSGNRLPRGLRKKLMLKGCKFESFGDLNLQGTQEVTITYDNFKNCKS